MDPKDIIETGLEKAGPEQANGDANGAADEMSLDDREEADHFEQVVNVFRYYKAHSLLRLRRDYTAYCKLPENHRKMLHPRFPQHLVAVKECITKNYRLLRLIIRDVGGMFENADHESEVAATQLRPGSELNMEKLQSTLKQFVRDWSEEGACERTLCYKPVLDVLNERFKEPAARTGLKVLVPGAGLGRLAWEIAQMGFECQGNEFSLFMLFCSNFVLNRCQEVNGWTLYPWIHQTCNNRTYSDQIRPVHFPDVNPMSLGNSTGFSMAAGNFLEVYANDVAKWDCVATVFFLDTAHNVLEYIETIRKILKPGGLWINLGPLLYHFADMPNEDSIELPYEEVRSIVQRMGFRLDEERIIKTSYTRNCKSMLYYEYECAFFVCTKLDSKE